MNVTATANSTVISVHETNPHCLCLPSRIFSYNCRSSRWEIMEIGSRTGTDLNECGLEEEGTANGLPLPINDNPGVAMDQLVYLVHVQRAETYIIT